MWARYHIKCHICDKITNMRIQIPDKELLKVSFPCNQCETELGGELTVDFEKVTFAFQANRGELVNYDHYKGDFFVEISDTLPTKKPSTEPHSVVLPTFRLKDPFKTKQAKDLKVIVKDEHWEKLLDLCVAYRNLNKPGIKKISSELLPLFGLEVPNFEKEIDYHITFLNCVNHVIRHWLNIDFNSFVSFLKSDVYNDCKSYYDKIQDFFSDQLNNNEFDSLRVECCDLIIRFIRNKESFLYVYKEEISEDDYISNENFVTLKNFYTDCFETLGKYSHLIFRLQNIIERGNENSVPSDAPRDITNAESLSNRNHGNKLEVLEKSNIPELEYLYSGNSFDHRLRNGINHQKAHLNRKEQTISYYPITSRPDEEFTIGYHEFLKKTLFSFSSIFSLIQLVFFAYLNESVR